MTTILKCTLNCNFVAKYLHKSMFLKTSNRKIIKITFESSAETFYVSLKILDNNFGYFKSKHNLNVIDQNKNCIQVSCVTKDMFGTLLEFITKG